MSKKIIDCVFFRGNQNNMKVRLDKFNEVVDKFVIFHKGDIDVSIISATTKPIDFVLVTTELFIDELKKYVRENEFDFEDIICISVTNEFYKFEILDQVKNLLPFGAIILEKDIFHTDTDPVEYETQRGTCFFFVNQIKYSSLDVSKIWLKKQKYDESDVIVIPGGYQI
jgi:hypothetical protein